MLAWPIYLSFAAALVSFGAGRCCPSAARWIALLASVAGFACAAAGALGMPAEDGTFTLIRVSWIPWLGAEYFLAADGISVVMAWLTGLAATAGVLFSWNVTYRPGEFFGWYLALIGAVYGVFLSYDLLLFFVFYEIAIIPKYFLIATWGSTRREYGAMKLALYSFASSALVLIGIIAAYVLAGSATFDLAALSAQPLPETSQRWLFGLVFVGFAVLAGLWPFHTWAPTGHVAAPTAASMLLAGVIMKLGAYGCLRVALALFPAGLAAWAGPIAALAGIGIVWGAVVALRQSDFKFVIGYSSVSHMGFVLLGLAAATSLGLSGAVLQMFSHGIIAGLLFAVVGRMVYDRFHTRDLAELGAQQLRTRLPFALATFVAAGFAGMGLPGFSGFVAELSVLAGAWRRFPLWVGAAGIGLVIGVAYTLRTIQLAFFRAEPGARGGDSGGRLRTESPSLSPVDPVSWPEKIGAGLLIAATLIVGLYPRILLDWILPALKSPLFAELRRRVGE